MILKWFKEGIEFPIQSEMYKSISKEFLLPRAVTFNMEDRGSMVINKVFYKGEFILTFISSKGLILKVIH